MSIPAPCGNVKHFVTPRRVAYGDRFRWATCYVTICDMTAHVAERRGALSEVVAANVRAECARRGWHQGVVAERMGMARNAVSDRARGRTPWTLDEVAQLAVLFGVEVSELLARPKGFEPLTFWLGADYSLTVFEVGRVRSLGSIRSLRYAGACDACGKASEPFAALRAAATLAEDHEQRHARARELTVERFLTAPVFS